MPDSKRVLSASRDKTLKLWDIDTGQCLRTLDGPHSPVALLPDGKHAISGSDDHTLELWDLESGLCLATWQAESFVNRCAAVLDTIVAGTGMGEVLFLRLMPPGRIVPETIAATWHPSRPLLAVARANGTLLLQTWHPESQFLEELARTSIPSITSVQWAADGARLLATTKDGTTRVFDAVTLAEIVPAPACDLAEARDVSADGAWRVALANGQVEVVRNR